MNIGVHVSFGTMVLDFFQCLQISQCDTARQQTEE